MGNNRSVISAIGMTRAVKDAFDAGDIDIPFPTTTMIQG